MAKTYPMQASFAVGVITGRSIARLDTEMYRQAVAVLENMIPTSQGPAIRRNGSEDVGAVGFSGPKKMFEFQSNDFHTYGVLVIGNSGSRRLYVCNASGVLIDVANDLIGSYRAFSTAAGWTTYVTPGSSGTVDFQQGACTLTNGDSVGDIAYLSHHSAGLTPGSNYTLRLVFDEEYEDSPVDITLGTSLGANDLGEDSGVKGLTHERNFTGPAGGNIYIAVKVSELGTSKRVTYFSAFLSSAASTNLVEFITPTGWVSADAVDTLQAEIAPGTYEMFFASLYTTPYRLTYDPTTEGWAFAAPTFTATPWSGGDYPGTVTFFESRSFWGGSNANPETVWASKTTSILDMTTGSLAADALVFTINSKGKIRWMVGAKTLVIGTAKAEHIVTSESGLTPSDTQVDQQSANGSARIQPAQVGNRIVYVSPDARKVRTMKYEWTEDGWTTKDLSYFALGLTTSRIKSIHFSPNPDNKIFCLLKDGKALICVYDKENELYGWANYETNNLIDSAINYEMHGTSHMLAISDNLIRLFRAKYYLDHTHRRTNPVPISQISGMTSVSGESVSVIVDGVYAGDFTVTLGIVNFTPSGYDVFAGLPYLSKLITLPLSGAKASGGLGVAGAKRHNKLWARVIAQTLPKINGITPDERYLDDPMVLTGEDYARDVAIQDLGFSQYAQIEISTDSPFRMDICGVFSESSQDVLE